MYPLRFRPLFRRYLWGGRRLQTVLHKDLGPGDDYAESWEIVDRGVDQSQVMYGPLAGMTLHELIETRGPELLGESHLQPSFPLLFKFLDANDRLSVQVHPDDALAARLDPPDLGKTEAWVVMAAEPGSVIYAGLKRGFDREALAREVVRGTTHLCLHTIEPQVGDCIFLPAGVVHAIGAGLVIAEIQQASDTTYRLFDWNRVGKDGQPRPLHIDAALAAIDYQYGPVSVQVPRPTEDPRCELLVACDKFVLRRWQAVDSVTIPTRGRSQLLAMLAGSARLAGDPSELPLSVGQTALIPASCEGVQLQPDTHAHWLQIDLP